MAGALPVGVLAPVRRWASLVPWPWQVFSSGILLLALGLRLTGINDLVLFGDSAASVYFAMQDWIGIAAATAVDSHPPGYYYLLRLSLDGVGWNEFGARLVSVMAGVLLVAAVLAVGRRLAGVPAALAVGLLAAISPPLVVYSRQPRMYALLALLSVALLMVAARPGRSLRRELATLALAFAALMTHYFAVVVVAAAAVVALARRVSAGAPSSAGRSPRAKLRLSVRMLWPFAVAVALWLPWLAFALGESLRHTERTISGVPPQPTLLHFLGSLAVAAPLGTFVPLFASIGLAAVWWAVVGGVIVAGRRWPGWPALAALAMALGATGVYLLQPAFGRPRFFIVLTPLALLILAAPLAAHRPLVASGATALLAATALGGLALTIPVERGTYELDAVRLGESLSEARPSDVVILQPWWQAGYLRTRLGSPPVLRALHTIPEAEWPSLVAAERQIWLVLTGVGRRDPAAPIEGWLDRHAYRVNEQTIGALRVVRYVVAPEPALPSARVLPNGLAFAAAPATHHLRSGDPLPVLVSWEATRPVDERVVLFLHLRAQDGSGWAGRDEEPDAGARLDGRWTEGERLLDRRGLVVPEWTPPGVYRLVSGVYRRSDGQRIGDETDLGEVRVARAFATGKPIAVFGEAFALEAARLILPDPGAARRTVIATVDGPQTLVEPVAARQGEVLPAVLRWRLVGVPVAALARLQLLDPAGGIVVERQQPPAGPADPPVSWTDHAIASGRFDLALPPSLAHGRYQLRLALTDGDGKPLAVEGRDALDLGRVLLGD